MKPDQGIAIVVPGTFLRMYPDRQTGRPFLKRTTILGKEIPFEGSPVFEVNRFILDREGGHVTFERREGTFYALGGGAIEDVEFPYPHPMFEVIDEAEAA